MSRKRHPRSQSVQGRPAPDLQAILPAGRSARLLPLEQMHETSFEHICVDLVEVEPDVIRAELKKVRGVAQYGVDVEGFSSRQAPTVVLSAKRYQRIIPSDLKTWSEEFLKHWDEHWKNRDVKRFVLAVTVELNDDALSEQIAKEAARFDPYGVQYEIWGLKQLTGKLRRHPEIIANYLHPAWIDALGGPNAGLAAGGAGSLRGEASRQIASGLTGAADALQARYGAAIAREFADALVRLEQGVARPLQDLIQRLRSDPLNWDPLPAGTKAKLLRAEGSLALRRRDLARARNLYRDAAAYAPPKDRSAAALVKRFEDGPEAAVAEIAEPQTRQEASILAGLLIESGRPEDAESVLDNWPALEPDEDPDEPLRLRALARALRRRDQEALDLIRQAETLASRDYAVAWAGGMIRFTAALSPAVPFFAGDFPNPVNPGLVRSDDTAQGLLDEAERIFDRLARTVDAADLIADLEVWRLACLVAHPARAADAQRLVTELTSRRLPHPGAVAWAVAGGIAFKQDQVVNACTKAVAAGTGSASHAVAAGIVLASRGAEKRALRTLQRARNHLAEANDLALIDLWIARLSGADENTAPPNRGVSRHRTAMTALLKRGDPSGFKALIAEDALDPEALFGAFEALAARRQWSVINDHRSRLVAFRTARAIEIAAVAAFESNDPQSCLTILQEGRGCFHAEHLPHRLRVIEARSHVKLGRPDLALELAESLRASGPEESAVILELARLRIGIGDLAGAAEVMRRLRPRESVSPDDRMQIAWELRRQDPQLARSLLSDIAWERLQQRVVPSAFALTLELGLDDAQRVLFPKFQEASKSKDSGVMVIGSVEEAIAFAQSHAAQRRDVDEQLRQKWLAAEIPAHAAFDADPIAFAGLFYEPFRTSPTLDPEGVVAGIPLLLRSGHVQDALERDDPDEESADTGQKASEPPSAAPHLRLDISAVLLGQQLGCLDKLNQIASPVSVAQDLPDALRTLEEAFAERFGPVAAPAQIVLAALDDGRLAVADVSEEGDQTCGPRILIRPPDGGREEGVRLGNLLRSLVTTRGFDPAVAANILRALELSPSDEEAVLPPPTQRLGIAVRDAISLAGIGFLETLLRYVDLCTESNEVTAFRQELEANEIGHRHRTSLGDLRRFVAERLESGAWQFLPEATLDPELKAVVRSSPILRSLASLLKAPSDPAAVAWVEDRAMSALGHIEQTPIVQVDWVLDRLRTAGALDNVTYQGVERRLRLAGYGFRLPKASEIMEALWQAPLRAGQIVETERLALYRTDYAFQLANSRHLTDKLPGGPPAQGPELRFIARLTSWAANILPLMWSDPAASAERKQAASWWAWRALRTEQMSFFPRENPTPEATRALVFLGLLSLVTAAFRVEGGTSHQGLAHREEYLAWAFGAIIDPLVRVEPEFADRLVNHTAHYLARFLEVDLDHPELTPHLLAATVANLVEAFPETWKERIQGHELLREPLQLRTVETVTVGENLEFEAADFFAAAESMLGTGRGTAPLIGSGAVAVFEPMAPDETGHAHPARYTVVSGKRIARLEDDSTLLAHPDVEVRRAALARHPDWFDQSGRILAATTAAIAQLPTVVERLAALRTAQQRSIPWRLAKLAGQIRTDRRSDRDLLAPPPPDLLRAYLRLPLGLWEARTGEPQPDLAAALTRAAERLASELGALEGLRRLAGFPMEFPTSFTEAIASAVTDGSTGLDQALRQTGETPLAAAALAHALRKHANIADATRQEALQRFSEIFTQHGRLFVSLLRWTFRVAGRDSAWAGIGEPERSALLWCHANSVTTILAAENVAPPDAADLLDRFDKEDITETYYRSRRELAFSPALLDPAGRLSSRTLAAAATVQVLRAGDRHGTDGCGDREREVLQPIVAFQIGERWAPNIDLLNPPDLSASGLTWLDVDAGNELRRVDLVELPDAFAERDHQAVVTHLLEQIEHQPENAREGQGVWPFLWLTDPSRLPPELRARLEARHTAEGLKQAFDGGGDVLMRALSFRAHLLALEGDIDGFLGLLVESAQEAAGRSGRTVTLGYDFGPEGEAADCFIALVEASWVFASRRSGDLGECIAMMATAADRIATEWRGSVLGCIALLDGLLRHVPITAAEPVWRVINKLKARPV